MPSIVAVPGLKAREKREPGFVYDLWAMAQRHGWEADAIATIMSLESGVDPSARNPLPNQTATGLIQMIEDTARRFGTSTDALVRMSGREQLPYVEQYYLATIGDQPPEDHNRRVDYYLAGWGVPTGLPMQHVMAYDGGRLYALNSALDRNQDGRITVSDLDSAMASQRSLSAGDRVQAVKHPMPKSLPMIPVLGSGAALTLGWWAWRKRRAS